jgi:sugar O-acyltransferase (sialic acid O-acetyltransferase NeuD family)
MKPILLVGGGGHCHSCIDVIEVERAFSIQGVVEQSSDSPVQVLGYPVVGVDADLALLLESTPSALVTVGQVKSPTARMILHDLLVSLGADLPVIISPSGYVSTHASVGEGTIVMHGAIVNALASVGRNCIVNSQSLIEHDAVVMDHCHISTGARINGGAEVGSGSFIGSGAVLREGVRVGPNCVIGAGTIVVEDLPASTRYVGTL